MATVAAPPPHTTSPAALYDLLAGLYVRQREASGPNPYLEEHARPRTIRGHVEMFHRYLPHLPRHGAILDWGCNHAPDSCLLRAARGDAYALYGCDFPPPGTFEAFHGFADFEYRPLEDIVRIPFGDGQFDAVVGGGTLEHTAMDYESLKEVHRVLKPGGVFVASYLPNWLSYGEFLRRAFNRPHHLRLYGLAETRRLLLHTGFQPLRVVYQCWGWERRTPRLAPILRVVAPVQIFCSTLFAVGRKVGSM